MRTVAIVLSALCFLVLGQLRAGDPDGDGRQRQVLIQIISLRLECLENFLSAQQNNQMEASADASVFRNDTSCR